MTFDPSKVTPEQVPSLTDEQLNQYQVHLESVASADAGSGAAKPEVPAKVAGDDDDAPSLDANGQPITTDEIVVKDVETKPEGSDKANPSTGAESDAGTTDEPVKFAGKFETPEDLIKGVESEIKTLGLDPELFKAQIDAASAAEDYGQVENLYKRLGAEVSKRQAASEVEDKPNLNLPESEVRSRVAVSTYSDVMQSQVVADMRRNGIEIPKSNEEMEVLRRDQPYYAFKFEAEYEARYAKNLKIVEDFRTASKDVVDHNTSLKSEGRKEIETLAKKYGVSLKEEELNTVIGEALKDQGVYENRAGVSFLKKGAILNHFVRTKLVEGGMLDKVVMEARTKGRAEAAVMRPKPHQTMSRSKIPATGSAKQPVTVDLNNPKAVENLSDEQLDRIYNKKS